MRLTVARSTAGCAASVAESATSAHGRSRRLIDSLRWDEVDVSRGDGGRPAGAGVGWNAWRAWKAGKAGKAGMAETGDWKGLARQVGRAGLTRGQSSCGPSSFADCFGKLAIVLAESVRSASSARGNDCCSADLQVRLASVSGRPRRADARALGPTSRRGNPLLGGVCAETPPDGRPSSGVALTPAGRVPIWRETQRSHGPLSRASARRCRCDTRRSLLMTRGVRVGRMRARLCC